MIDMKPTILQSDCLSLLRLIPTNSYDLVFTSPPYEMARQYNDMSIESVGGIRTEPNKKGYDIGIESIGGIESVEGIEGIEGIEAKSITSTTPTTSTPLSNQLWVDWAFPIYMECLRVCKGLVAWVVEGQTKQFKYSATPILLMAELHKAGVTLRKPPIYHRVGIPGSGGPDWLRNDYEFIICATKRAVKRLPWSDNTACGHHPKYAPGGDLSHRTHTDERVSNRKYKPPTKANPGNVIKCNVGGGQMGSPLAHQNEAPFPESLAEFFIKSFCPPGGIVLDPFVGSGTTLAVAMRNDRQSVGIDIRSSQIKLSKERCGIE